jgi:ATP-dependent RNA helicase RhlE
MNTAGIFADAIHGNKSQNARQRALSDLKTRKIRVLIATDIAARGIDVDELSHVINYDLPEVAETYIHRIGRTGRAGLGGIAISFCDDEERIYLKDINKLTSNKIKVIEDHPFMSLATDTKVMEMKENYGYKKPIRNDRNKSFKSYGGKKSLSTQGRRILVKK